MKEINDMTLDELTSYFIDKKIKGASFRELSNIFEKNSIDSEKRKIIMIKLDEIDKKQQEFYGKLEKSSKKKQGIKSLLIGLGVVIFGFLIFTASAKAGVIFILNFIIWGFGGLLILRGLLGIIGGFKD